MINQSRRVFLRNIGLFTGSLALSSCNISSNKNLAKKPNIVLIMADDMGYSDIGCYGGEIRTPSLDRLAKNGLRYSQFYNNARCCPTRASLLTGLYPHQTGIGHMLGDLGLEGYRGDLSKNTVTIAELLKQAGYRTYMSGKWHVTRYNTPDQPKHNWPRQRGFDQFFGTITGAGSYYNPVTLTLDNDFIEADHDFYYTDSISEYAVKYLKHHLKNNSIDPFFLYVSFTSPHWPLHALKNDVVRYKGRYDKGWDVLRRERYQRLIKLGLVDSKWQLSKRDESQMPWENVTNKKWQARRMEVYAAQIDRMDQGIGKIVSAIKEQGEIENTLILFLADNGGCAEELSSTQEWLRYYSPAETKAGIPTQTGNDPEIMPGPETTYQSYGIPWANVSNTPFRFYKHWVHEGGIASPLIIHWPSRIVNPGEVRRQPTHLIDIMATCVAAANAEYPKIYNNNAIQPMEGQNLAVTFDNGSIERDGIYFEHEGNRAIRVGKWKLVSIGREGEWELYDMEKDRTEINNLVSQYPERVEIMSSKWNQWAKRTHVLPWPEKLP